MSIKHRAFYGPLLALFLTAALVAGCGSGPLRQGKATPSTSSVQDYDRYDETSILQQQKFDQLTDHLFTQEVVASAIDLHYTIADPASYGITDIPGTFGNLSLDQMVQDTKDLKELRGQLAGIEPERLTEDQRLTYQILSSYIDTELAFEGMELYFEPVSPTIGIQAQLPILLAEYSFYTKQDVDIYLGLLSQIDEYYAQILEFEKTKSAAGLFMSDTAVDDIVESCQGYLLPPEHSFLTETFTSRLEELGGLTQEEKDAYSAMNQKILTEHFIPAYRQLTDGLQALKGTGVYEGGLANYPDGKKYYEYLVRSNTGTSYETIDDLQNAIERQMGDDLAESSKILRRKPDLYDQLDTYSFKYTEPAEILNDLQEQIKADFPTLPPCSYTVKHVPKALESSLSPAFYLTPPIDRYQENVIYINDGTQEASTDLYTTLAHEGYPGHLYQTVYFTDGNSCDLRKLLSFSSYTEGWATYVEYYSYGLDNGLDPDLGRLLAHTSSATLALHALLDININYYGWNQDQVTEYLRSYYDVDGTDVAHNIYYTMIENPTNYLEYYVGYLEILNMKQKAERLLGDSFDLKEFHRFILDTGPAPFPVIRSQFNDWIAGRFVREKSLAG